jgi:hypothetical protein
MAAFQGHADVQEASDGVVDEMFVEERQPAFSVEEIDPDSDRDQEEKHSRGIKRPPEQLPFPPQQDKNADNDPDMEYPGQSFGQESSGGGEIEKIQGPSAFFYLRAGMRNT